MVIAMLAFGDIGRKGLYRESMSLWCQEDALVQKTPRPPAHPPPAAVTATATDVFVLRRRAILA